MNANQLFKRGSAKYEVCNLARLIDDRPGAQVMTGIA
jgi:hypothetical protein